MNLRYQFFLSTTVRQNYDHTSAFGCFSIGSTFAAGGCVVHASFNLPRGSKGRLRRGDARGAFVSRRWRLWRLLRLTVEPTGLAAVAGRRGGSRRRVGLVMAAGRRGGDTADPSVRALALATQSSCNNGQRDGAGASSEQRGGTGCDPFVSRH
jgi:hypothetical protein